MKIPFLQRGPQRPAKMINASILRATFDRRAVVIGAVQGGIGVLLALRLGYLSVAENEKYRLESESNRVNLTLIPPRRGWILDRDGAPLASNRADFRVDLIPERLVDAQATIDRLGELLSLEPARIADIKDKVATARGFQPVEVASGLRYEQFAALSVRLPDLPGVVPQRGFSRYYPTASSVGPQPAARHAGLQDRQGRAGEAVRKGTARRSGGPPRRGHGGRADRARSRNARGCAGQSHPPHH